MQIRTDRPWRALLIQADPSFSSGDSNLVNLLLDPYFSEQIRKSQTAWRSVVALAAQGGMAAPAFMSALAYYDGYRSETLPANLLQAQRDYFGAHSYERVDYPRGTIFHLDWSKPDRPEVKVKDSGRSDSTASQRRRETEPEGS